MNVIATTPFPCAATLVESAIGNEDCDFFRSISHYPDVMEAEAANAAEWAADLWEVENADCFAVPQSLIAEVTAELIARGNAMLAEREQAAADALADGIESGDLDADGEPVPYDRYWSV